MSEEIVRPLDEEYGKELSALRATIAEKDKEIERLKSNLKDWELSKDGIIMENTILAADKAQVEAWLAEHNKLANLIKDLIDPSNETDISWNGNLPYWVGRLKAEFAHWKANHQDMVNRNALLSQRTDLPIDRIPAHNEMVRLQKENGELRERIQEIEVVYEKIKNRSVIALSWEEMWQAIRSAVE